MELSRENQKYPNYPLKDMSYMNPGTFKQNNNMQPFKNHVLEGYLTT